MSKIRILRAHEIPGPHGKPLLQIVVETESKKNAHIQCVIPDIDDTKKQNALVAKAVNTITTVIAPILTGMEVFRQKEIDRILTELTKIKNTVPEINVTFLVSIAICKTAAEMSQKTFIDYIQEFHDEHLPSHGKLPVLMMDLFNRNTTSGIDFQSVSLIAARSKKYKESLELFRAIQASVSSQPLTTHLLSNADAIECAEKGIQQVCTFNKDIFIGMDINGADLKSAKGYVIKDLLDPLTTADLTDFYVKMINTYNPLIVEDPFSTDEPENALSDLNRKIADQTILSVKRADQTKIQKMIQDHTANAITLDMSIQPSITDMIEVVALAKRNDWKCILSGLDYLYNDDNGIQLGIGLAVDFLKIPISVLKENSKEQSLLLSIEERLHNNA